MSDARMDQAKDVAEPSVESARETAVRRLSQHAMSGSMTLDEYAKRGVAVEQAASADELDAALLGLPEETVGLSPARRARWLVSVFGGAQQRGRWRLSSRLRIVVAFGGVTLDLGTAQPEAPESVITVVAVFGGAAIIAPPGVSIQLSGFSLLGGKGDKRAGGPPLLGSPLIRVRAFAIFGGVTVKDRTLRRKLLDLIRVRSSKSPTEAERTRER